jgi:hypothetical protein
MTLQSEPGALASVDYVSPDEGIDRWMVCEALCRSQDSIAPKDREFSISKPQVLRYVQSRLGRLVSWLASYAKNGGLIRY